MSKAGALSLDSSFPLSRFLSPEVVEENLLECPICFLVLKDPFGASCSHICCLHCLKEWLDRDPSCPVCRLPIKRSDLKPLTGPLRNIYDSLKLKCDVEGCRDIITINSIQQHQSNIHKLFTTEKCNRNNEAQNSPVNSQWYKVGDDWNVWTITQLTKSLKDSQMSALSGRYIYVESPMGLTWFEGYSYVIQLYLHGHSRQCPSAVTACVRFVKGSYDDHLKWPFSHKMVIKLLDVPGVQKEVSFPDLTTPLHQLTDNDNPNRTSGYLELCSRQLLTSLRGDSLRLAVKFIPNKNEKRLIAVDPENHNYLKPNTNDMNNALVRSSRSFSTFPSQNSDKPINTRQSHSPPLTHETYWAPQIPSVNITRPSVMANGTPSTMIDMRRSRNISSSPHYRINMANPTPSVYPQPPPKPQPQSQPQSAPKPQPQPQPQIAKPQPQPQSAPKPQPQAQPVPKPQPVAKLAPQPSPPNLSPKLGYTRTPTFPNRPDPIQLSPTWNPNLYSARTAVNVVQHNAPKNSAAPRHIADPRRTRLM